MHGRKILDSFVPCHGQKKYGQLDMQNRHFGDTYIFKRKQQETFLTTFKILLAIFLLHYRNGVLRPFVFYADNKQPKIIEITECESIECFEAV